jgi:thiol-disulfide isomerase/thioredoxin
MKRNLHSAFLLFLSASLFLYFIPSASAAQDDLQPTIRFVRNPDPAPDFKLSTLDGKVVSVGAEKGKVVLLNFWATWCGPCRAEVPDLIELQSKYKDGLQIIGLALDVEDLNEVKKFVAAYGVNYPVAVASDEIRFHYGGIGALPTSFMIDTQGRVVQKHEGLRDPALYEAEIRSLLGLPLDGIKVETFDDTGEIFLKHADRASQLPGVDLSKLTPEQKSVALHRFNSNSCTCGCKFTLAQCRIYDRGCAISKAATAKIIADVSAAPAKSPSAPENPPATTAPSAPIESPTVRPAPPAKSPQTPPTPLANSSSQLVPPTK